MFPCGWHGSSNYKKAFCAMLICEKYHRTCRGPQAIAGASWTDELAYGRASRHTGAATSHRVSLNSPFPRLTTPGEG